MSRDGVVLTVAGEGAIIKQNKFDQLFAEAVPLVDGGKHQRDTPPEEGGRWPVSVVLRPPIDGALSLRLDALTAEAASIAGGGHWQTGQAGSAHLTVRALEYYRSVVEPDEPVIERYRAALERAASAVGPARIEVTGITLTPGTVMATAVPLDDRADLLMDRFKDELGDDAWMELGYGRRDIWYLNLLHFTTGIPSPAALINWVREHRSLPLGEATIRDAELVRFRHAPDGPRPFMRPHLIASAPLGASPS